MLRLREQLLCGANLRDAADVHDDDSAGNLLDDAEVVRHEEIGKTELVLQVH